MMSRGAFEANLTTFLLPLGIYLFLKEQLNGEYKIKEKNLILLFIEIWNLKIDFNKIKFTHIPREENKLADFLVNETLDLKASGNFM